MRQIRSRLAATVEIGGDKSCLTTYIFNPAETCTGVPSPEKSPLNTSLCDGEQQNAKRAALQVERHMHQNFLFGKIIQDSRPNFIADYELNYKNCNFDVGTHGKCCVGGHFGDDLSFGHLYTISSVLNRSRNDKEERMYDEPCTGELPRRSWLCCPGSQRKDGDEPGLLETKKETTPSPPDAITREPSRSFCSGTCERLQQQLDEQAQRYEEQLTELHSVIAELTRKLHHQRTMAIAEEDEISETCTSVHDESVTCPLEVSELEPLEPDSSDLDNRIHLAESPSELPEPKLNSSNNEQNESSPSLDIEPLKQEINRLKCQLQDAQYKLAQYAISKDEIMEEMTNGSKNLDSPESHIEVDCKSFQESSPRIDIKYSNIVPIHKNKQNNSTVSTPISKVAERVKLKRTSNGIKDSNSEVVNAELTTAVAEHIVGDILRHCDTQNEKTSVDIELRQLYTKLEHARAQNNVLVLTLSETKAHCDRLALLCGKYESNAVALRLALGVTDRAIEAYDVLLALLETELALNEGNAESIQNRSAAETVAKQLLTYLDSYEISSDMLLSPWQNHVYDGSKIDNNEMWTTDHETRLREHVSRLKAERSNIQGTYVALESTYVENVSAKPINNQESRKMDLEMAVLLQELMSLREEKSELVSKIFALEKDKSAMQLKLKYVEGQQRAQSATLKNLQGQLKDTEALLALASQNRERGYSDAEHAQGVEVELMQALAREGRLKVRLQELVSTLEQVTKNAEARLLEGREIVHDLNQTNSVLAETVDRNNKRYQAKFKKMEQQMLTMVEKHTAQVHTLQQRIASMETPPTNSSDNSLASLAV